MKTIETSNQNSDKQKTYDYCRIEYSFLSSIIFLDADEIFHCETFASKKSNAIPLPVKSFLQLHHQSIQIFLETLENRHFEEVSIKRYNVYSLLWETVHLNITHNVVQTSPHKTINSLLIDATNQLKNCILVAYQTRSIIDMFKCWSNQLKSGPNPKSFDISNRCPFHWNHLSCKINTLEEGDNNQTKPIQYSDSMYLCPCKTLDLSNTTSSYPINKNLKVRCVISHLSKYLHSHPGVNSTDIYNHKKLFDTYQTSAIRSFI